MLGHGSMGTIYEAKHIVTGESVAVKVIDKQQLQKSIEVERFRRELAVMDSFRTLRHPNVVSLIDLFEDEQKFYLVTELCTGGDLFDYIADNGAINERVASIIFKQILDGLIFIHQNGIVHRDLKPENIFITRFPSIKIGDFGLCGFTDFNTLMNSFCGSPCYCSPECLKKESYDGIKADTYSLGVTLFCMVTGQFPWNIEVPQKMIERILQNSYVIPSHVSPQCADLIHRLMALNPADRPSHTEILNHPWLQLFKSGDFGYNMPKEAISFPALYDTLVFSSKSKIQTSKSIGKDLHICDLLNNNADIVRKKSVAEAKQPSRGPLQQSRKNQFFYNSNKRSVHQASSQIQRKKSCILPVAPTFYT